MTTMDQDEQNQVKHGVNECEVVVHGIPWVDCLAEGVGNAPTSASADPVFETGAASLYLPAFQKRLLLALNPNLTLQVGVNRPA